MTRQSAFYSPEFARRVIHHMRYLEDLDEIKRVVNLGEHDDRDDPMAPETKHVFGDKCGCRKIHQWNHEITCAHCMLMKGNLAYVGEEAPDDQENMGNPDDAVMDDVDVGPREDDVPGPPDEQGNRELNPEERERE